MQNNKLQTLQNSILARIKLVSISDDDEIGFWITSKKSNNEETISHFVFVCNKKVTITPHTQYIQFSRVAVVEQDVYYEN